MFFRSLRGRRDPHFLPIRDYEDPIRLDEARLDAWAIALGEPRRATYRAQRSPRRGMLPDVDFSRVVPVGRRSGPMALLFRWFAGKAPEPAGTAETPGETAESGLVLGETRRKPYVWLVEPNTSDEAAPDAAAAKHDGSRAA